MLFVKSTVFDLIKQFDVSFSYYPSAENNIMHGDDKYHSIMSVY